MAYLVYLDLDCLRGCELDSGCWATIISLAQITKE
jgi:hypothetical protein